MKNCLLIHELMVFVKIGVSEEERKTPQKLLLNLNIDFIAPFKCAINDNISDAVCYDQLTEDLSHFLSTKEYHLIEHLSLCIHQFLTGYITFSSHILVEVIKFPKIKDLQGYVSFKYGDST